jgi:DNA-binding CsgD family transcriptional regulator
MSDTASKLAPAGRLRVAVHATDLLRRNALSRVVAEAGHSVVAAWDAADVVLADGDGPPGETRPVVALGGADDDLAGVLSRDAMDGGFGAMRETEGHALLTPRELEVLATLAEGMTNKAIARRLNISLHTVKYHVESLFRKLGARTRTEAVAKASERRRQETITL